MRELWLRSNQRALVFGCVPPALAALVGVLLLAQGRSGAGSVPFIVGAFLLVAGLAGLAVLLSQIRRPRVAYENGEVQFFLRRGRPIAVPVEIIEAFFVGQGPAHLPVVSQQPLTVNLIARLSQRHTEWRQQEVKPSLGSWANGYVIIRGSWCEPLNGELIRRLNRRLREVQAGGVRK